MKAMLKLTLFGAPTVVLAGQIVTRVLTGKLLALFVYLAVTAVKGEPPHSREAVADLFWSELPSGQRRSNLRYLLADLRRIVGDYLIITTQTVCFNRQAAYWLDVEVVYSIFSRDPTAVTPAEAQAARALYHGEFLAGFRVRNAPGFAQWVTAQRQELHALLNQAAPAPAQLAKTNLPNQLTPFFGREAEIAAIVHQLRQDDYRLLTIIGEGGVGKTRLALAVAQAILDFRFWLLEPDSAATNNQQSTVNSQKFPDGVWFVPLADVTATPALSDQLATAIAKALNFALSGQGAPTTQVFHYLAHKRLLLLLDNFEQLADHPDFLLTLLQKCRGVRLLVTSRRQLNVQAAYPWRLTGLPLPPVTPTDQVPAAEALHYAGLALFAERARRADPHFQCNATNQAVVRDLCHLLEGLPLAIELAAALCKEYTCHALLAALQADYRILTTTLPDLPPRHRSIKVVLDHSWRLLDDTTATILAACTVFHNSFTAEAAAAVTGATAAHLHRLVDHSLLRINRSESSGWRYELHELVRHYAREQVAQRSARQRQVLAHHAAYYLAQLQQAEPLLWQSASAQATVRCDLTNMTAAWHWAVTEQRLDLLAQGVEGLARFYNITGLLEEGLQLLQAALPVARQSPIDAHPHESLLKILLRNASELCIYLVRLEEAEALAQEALLIGQAHNDDEIQGWGYEKLARVAQRRNQALRMRELAEQAYALADQSQNTGLQASCSNTLGVAAFLCGDLAESLHWYHQALAKLDQAQNARLAARLHGNLGYMYKRLWDYDKARHHLTAGLTVAQQIQDRHSIAVNLVISGDLWLDVGAFDLAHSALAQAIALLQEIHDPYWEAEALTALARLLHWRGDYTAAVQTCQRALARCAGRIPYFEHRALTYYGDAYWTIGDPLTAEELYQRALALQNKAQLDYCLAEPAIRLAELQCQRNAYSAALALLAKPLARLQQQGAAGVAEPFGVYLIGYRVFHAMGDPRADRLLEQAYRLFQATLANIADAPVRQSFLANMPWRHELWALVQTQFGAD